jgi:uncharacterized membrane protein
MDYRDGIVWLGLLLVAVGIGLWSVPAAVIFCGAGVAIVGLFARPRRKEG